VAARMRAETVTTPFLPEPPQALDAEEHVLGACLISDRAIEACAEILKGLEFYRDSHRNIYLAILACWRDSQPVDPITVADHMHADKDLKQRIHELAQIVPATSNAAHHAKIVRAQWEKRLLADFFHRGYTAAMNGHTPLQLVDRIEQRVIDLRSLIERGQRAVTVTTAQLADTLEAEIADPPERTRGVPCPFRFQRPLQPGRLYVLAGQTAHGKTVLGVQYARAACEDGRRVGFFSIEMTREQLYDRMIATFGVPLTQIEARLIAPAYRDLFAEGIRRTRAWKAEINDDSAADSAKFRRWQKLRRYDLLIIDHLHEIQVPGRATDHRINLEAELNRIKAVAKDLEVPILLLAQLSRPAAGQAKPTLAMLRETGRIEQVAAQVAFVYRETDEHGLPTLDAELIVAKDRFGPTGKAKLRFDGECVRFLEVADG